MAGILPSEFSVKVSQERKAEKVKLKVFLHNN
jgi:hypothetical protein